MPMLMLLIIFENLRQRTYKCKEIPSSCKRTWKIPSKLYSSHEILLWMTPMHKVPHPLRKYYIKLRITNIICGRSINFIAYRSFPSNIGGNLSDQRIDYWTSSIGWMKRPSENFDFVSLGEKSLGRVSPSSFFIVT